MEVRHGIPPFIADDALRDPARVTVSPDYNSASGRSIRVIGYSVLADQLITVILLPDGDTVHGVYGWPANDRDRRIYREADDEQQT